MTTMTTYEISNEIEDEPNMKVYVEVNTNYYEVKEFEWFRSGTPFLLIRLGDEVPFPADD